MLVSFEFLVCVLSMFLARLFITFSKKGISDKFNMSKLLIESVMSLMNNSFSILFLMIVLLHVLIISSDIEIMTVKGTWSEERC